MTRRDGVAASSYYAAVKPHPRIRKFLKWGGVVGSIVLCTVWIGSAFVECGYEDPYRHLLYLYEGEFSYYHISLTDKSSGGVLKWNSHPYSGLRWLPKHGPTNLGWFVVLPLWPFVLVSTATTAAAWRMDTLAQRRKRFGGCPACGYDRAGLAADAPCPECNTKA